MLPNSGRAQQGLSSSGSLEGTGKVTVMSGCSLFAEKQPRNTPAKTGQSTVHLGCPFSGSNFTYRKQKNASDPIPPLQFSSRAGIQVPSTRKGPARPLPPRLPLLSQLKSIQSQPAPRPLPRLVAMSPASSNGAFSVVSSASRTPSPCAPEPPISC